MKNIRDFLNFPEIFKLSGNSVTGITAQFEKYAHTSNLILAILLAAE